jgi:hypothetical protein
MDQLKNMATKLSGSSGDKASSNSGAQQTQGQNQDYVDKAFAAGQKKFGIPANEGVNERIVRLPLARTLMCVYEMDA